MKSQCKRSTYMHLLHQKKWLNFV